MEEVFKTSVIEALQYYVYCLVDPRTNRIFYIGKGSGNRIFNHANDALNDNLSSLKLNIIREVPIAIPGSDYFLLLSSLTTLFAFRLFAYFAGRQNNSCHTRQDSGKHPQFTLFHTLFYFIQLLQFHHICLSS